MNDSEAMGQDLRIISPNLPRVQRAMSRLPLKKGTVCVLKMSGYSLVEIQLMTGHAAETIKRYVEDGKIEYPNIAKYLE